MGDAVSGRTYRYFHFPDKSAHLAVQTAAPVVIPRIHGHSTSENPFFRTAKELIRLRKVSSSPN